MELRSDLTFLPPENLSDQVWTAGHENWIMRSVGKKWKNWKATIKKEHYKPSLSVDAQMQNKPQRVKEDQWKELLQIWQSEDAKELSQKNKSSRAKQKMIPRTGKKSFAEVAEEEKEKLGHYPSRMDLFSACYLKHNRDGTESACEAAKEAIDKKRKLIEEAPEGYDDSTSRSDIFSQVMGEDKNGYMRMYGLGVCPSDVWGETPSRATSYRMAMNLKTQVEDLTNKIHELQSSIQGGGHANNTSQSANVPETLSGQHTHSSDIPFDQHMGTSRPTSTRQPIRVRAHVS